MNVIPSARMSDAPSRNVEHETAIVLGLLNAVERNSQMTQRSVANELGIALGLTNAYLRRCVKKGWIKVNQIPAKRYAYYLTPRGFAEKSRLTADYLTSSLHFFRKARAQIEELLAQCARRGCKSVVLCGASDLAEIARLCSHDHGITVLGVLDSTFPGSHFHGLAVYPRLEAMPPVDAVLVTGMADSPDFVLDLAQKIDPERLFIPEMLGLPLKQAGSGLS